MPILLDSEADNAENQAASQASISRPVLKSLDHRAFTRSAGVPPARWAGGARRPPGASGWKNRFTRLTNARVPHPSFFEGWDSTISSISELSSLCTDDACHPLIRKARVSAAPGSFREGRPHPTLSPRTRKGRAPSRSQHKDRKGGPPAACSKVSRLSFHGYSLLTSLAIKLP
jgi:hypothetical protein